MRVLLCALNSKYIHSSLAVWYLSAAVRGCKDIDCQVYEATINEKEDKIFDDIQSYSADLIAFSTYIWNKEMVLRLAERMSRASRAKILLGGPEVSYNACELMEKYSFIDYIISGEGEEPFYKLCNGYDEEEIEGLIYKKCGGVCENQSKSPQNDPPNPYTEEYLNRLNGRITYIETSRGCPNRCAFCLSGRCGGVRFFDLENSKRNILLLAKSGTQTVKFVDRTFNADRKRACYIWEFIISEYGNKIPKGVCFHFEIDGALVDEKTIEVLKKAPSGLFQFEIGLQSFNPSTLKAVNRRPNLEKLTENIKQIIGLGNIHTHIDLIIGLPYEALESFKVSFDKAYRLKAHMLQVGFLKLLHGSEIRENDAYKCEFSDTPPYEIKSNQWLSANELDKLHLFEDVFERMYNSRRFALTCEYLDTLFGSPYEMYKCFSDYILQNGNEKTLDGFTKQIYDYFSTFSFVDKSALRDKMAIDRLATNRMGCLPEFLKVHSLKIKETLNLLEKNADTKRPYGIKRAATVLLTENKLAYVDYDRCDYVTNRFLVKFTEI